MKEFEWLEPETLEDVKKALSSADSGTRVVSGGTALSLIMKQGIYSPERLISLKKVKHKLDYIREDEDGNLRIGAMATLKEIESSSLVARLAPVIVEALHNIANPRIRYVATIGGNLSHADAHLDLPPILLAMGERWIELKDFFNGYYVTALETNEILTEVWIPKQPEGRKGKYLKFTALSNDDWPTLGVALFMKVEESKITDIRLVVSAVTDVPTRLEEVEQLLLGNECSDDLIEEAGIKAFDLVDAAEDLRGSVWYKKEMVKVHVCRALKQLRSNV
jgi:carbon-monoxide dehydrogenase medium subunit